MEQVDAYEVAVRIVERLVRNFAVLNGTNKIDLIDSVAYQLEDEPFVHMMRKEH